MNRAKAFYMQLVVSDIAVAQTHLAQMGVEVSDIQDFPGGRFVSLRDPDGNGWVVQQIAARE